MKLLDITPEITKSQLNGVLFSLFNYFKNLKSLWQSCKTVNSVNIVVLCFSGIHEELPEPSSASIKNDGSMEKLFSIGETDSSADERWEQYHDLTQVVHLWRCPLSDVMTCFN